jgi:DNA-binding response OmpR family regulator
MNTQKSFQQWDIGGLNIRPDIRTIQDQSGLKISLRRKEFQLLQFMLNNINSVINKYTILDLIWEFGSFAGSNTLEVHLSSLRKKLKTLSSKLHIQTIRGVGYRMITV